jgi:hypothetical protein
METKHFASAAFMLAVGVTLAVPKPVAAFWPFDRPGDGQVQGATTQSTSGGAVQQFFEHLRPTTYRKPPVTPTPHAIQATALTVDVNKLKERLDEAVKNGKLTSAQEAEFVTRYTAITAKRIELKTMEDSFAAWLKSNNITTSAILPPLPKVTPGPHPSYRTEPTMTAEQRKYYESRRATIAATTPYPTSAQERH